MQQYAFSTIGEYHTQHNEDFSCVHDVGDGLVLMAVMDGCSMGTDSYFAATALGKILRKAAKEQHYQAFIRKEQAGPEATLKAIAQASFQQLQALQQLLHLDKYELLSTLLLGIVDTAQQKASLLVVGDGLVCCNGQLYVYEQDDRPDYLGYHLHKNFDDWYAAQQQRLNLEAIEDLSLATDGIFTFKPFDQKTYDQTAAPDLVDWLLKDKTGAESDQMLKTKVLGIESDWGLKPTDDLTILRGIF